MKPTSFHRLPAACMAAWLLAGLRLSAGIAPHEGPAVAVAPAPAAPKTPSPPEAPTVPPPPGPSNSFSSAPSYTFTTTDALAVAVYDEPDLSILTRVDTTGCINLNLVGTLKIAGLTITEAEAAVEKAYQDHRFLRHPQVTISIQNAAVREVSIQGQIKAPGLYPLPIETAMSVVDLVTIASGFTETAKGTAVSITHFDRDGRAHVKTVDVDDIIKGRDKARANDQSLMLEPGDIVFVPQNFI